MDFVSAFAANGWKRIAFVGLTKHAGKTTAMNSIIAEAADAGIPLGLCSIGLDGERLDTILGVAKPPVFVPAGTLIASAEKALQQSEVQFEYLEDTGITSPLGNILIARSIVSGQVLLAGVRQRRHVETVLPRLEALGAELSFVDGAFDRVAAAVPTTVDAAILAVGAVAGKTVPDVIATAYPFLLRFQLPVVEESVRLFLQSAIESGEIVAWIGEGTAQSETLTDGGSAGPQGEIGKGTANRSRQDRYTFIHFHRHQAILGLRKQPSWNEDISGLWLPGAASDHLLQILMSHPRPLELIIAHPAQLLAETSTLQKWYRTGHRIVVWEALPIAAIAINPHSITGYDLSGHELRTAVMDACPGVPVVDFATQREGGRSGVRTE